MWTGLEDQHGEPHRMLTWEEAFQTALSGAIICLVILGAFAAAG